MKKLFAFTSVRKVPIAVLILFIGAFSVVSFPTSAGQENNSTGKSSSREKIYTFDEIKEMSDSGGLCQLPGGEVYEVFFKRSDEEGFSARSTAHGGTQYLNMMEGYQLSYEFLVDNGEKEELVPGGIFEPVYYQVHVEKPSSPDDAFRFIKNNSQGEKILYDLPQNYSCKGKNGQEIEVRRIFKVTSLETGEEVCVEEPPVYVESLGEDKSSNKTGADEYEVKKGDSLWKIAERIMGNPLEWKRIYKLNSDRIKEPHWIYEGQVLDIPRK